MSQAHTCTHVPGRWGLRDSLFTDPTVLKRYQNTGPQRPLGQRPGEGQPHTLVASIQGRRPDSSSTETSSVNAGRAALGNIVLRLSSTFLQIPTKMDLLLVFLSAQPLAPHTCDRFSLWSLKPRLPVVHVPGPRTPMQPSWRRPASSVGLASWWHTPSGAGNGSRGGSKVAGIP